MVFCLSYLPLLPYCYPSEGLYGQSEEYIRNVEEYSSIQWNRGSGIVVVASCGYNAAEGNVEGYFSG